MPSTVDGARELMGIVANTIGTWSADNSKVAGQVLTIAGTFDYLAIRAIHKVTGGFAVDSHLANVVQEADGTGIALQLWAYVYPNNIDKQVQAIADAFSVVPGATDLILDAEGEWEGVDGSVAESLCSGIIDATGNALDLSLSSFYAPALHDTFPFESFCKHCNGGWMPQPYVHGDGEGNSLSLVLNRCLSQSVASKTVNGNLIPTLDDPRQPAMFKGHCSGFNAWLWEGSGSDPAVRDNLEAWQAAIADFKS
ncbi:MAG: hypothetical protein JSS72_09085 [Armatimonadetes bacterium]|nr:hypothetical protein [Armatimonadota bacterium]